MRVVFSSDMLGLRELTKSEKLPGWWSCVVVRFVYTILEGTDEESRGKATDEPPDALQYEDMEEGIGRSLDQHHLYMGMIR